MGKVTISIDLDNGNVKVDNPSATGNVSNNKSEVKPEANVFRCRNIMLAYKILDAGFLESLVAVEYDEKMKRNLYVFADTPDVHDVYMKFFENSKLEKHKRYQERMAAKNSKQVEEGATNNE